MKQVIVTGASSGIGKAITQTFCEKGWAVTMIARSADKLKELEAQWPNCRALPCDLSDAKAIHNLKDQVATMPVDALINNAGIFQPQSIDDDEDSVWENQLQTNLMGAIRLTRLCWHSLKRQNGCILNISSTLGIRPIAHTAAYSASKAAMNNWTQSLAIEGAEHGVRANALCPGIIDTPIHSYVDSTKIEDQEIYRQVQKAQPLGRTGQPMDVAAMAFHFCQPEAQWITGTLLNIDGGILLNS